jgi:ABC-type uncharacterized transport system substrate-binding protein
MPVIGVSQQRIAGPIGALRGLIGLALPGYSNGRLKIEQCPRPLILPKTLVTRDEERALLINSDNVVSEIEVEDMAMVARAAGLELLPVKANARAGLDAAFSATVAERTDALIDSADPFLSSKRNQIVALAAQHALPAAYPWGDYVESGGLMSYGPNILDSYYQIGIYAGRILRGERAGDLPVQLPLKFEFGINVRTAKALNLTAPRVTLLRADKVVE